VSMKDAHEYIPDHDPDYDFQSPTKLGCLANAIVALIFVIIVGYYFLW